MGQLAWASADVPIGVLRRGRCGGGQLDSGCCGCGVNAVWCGVLCGVTVVVSAFVAGCECISDVSGIPESHGGRFEGFGRQHDTSYTSDL